jgi:hypothetical protein
MLQVPTPVTGAYLWGAEEARAPFEIKNTIVKDCYF